MKKRYLVAAVVLAAILIVPKVISTQVTSTFNEFVKNINDASGYSVEVLEYNEGWFGSDGIVRFSLDLADIAPDNGFADEQQNLQVDVAFTSGHGPVFLTSGFGLGLAKWDIVYDGEQLREVLDWDADTNFYQLSATQSLFGGGSYNDSITAFTASVEESGGQVTFSGYAGQGEESGGKLFYYGGSEKFDVVEEQGKFSLNGLDVQLEVDGGLMQAMRSELVDSSIAFTITSMDYLASDANEPEFDLQTLTWEIESNINDDETLANMNQNIAVATINAMDYTISDLTFNMEFNQISADFLRAYQEFATQLQSMNEQEMQTQSLLFFQENALSLLQAEPQIKISDLSAKLPEGSFKATNDTQLVGINALPAQIEDPQFWLAHIVSSTSMVADKAVVNLIASQYMINQLASNPQTAGMTEEELEQIAAQQSPMMIETLMQQGLLVESTPGQLSVNFELRDSQAMLNGNPMPLPF